MYSHSVRTVFFPGLETLDSALGRNAVPLWLSWKEEVVHGWKCSGQELEEVPLEPEPSPAPRLGHDSWGRAMRGLGQSGPSKPQAHGLSALRGA